MAEAFFLDTWECVQNLEWALPIIATTDMPNSGPLIRTGAELWLQGDGDLGARIGTILTKGLSRSEFAIALGADSPGLPARLLDQAHRALRSADAVLGPCDDGGFYLLAVRRYPKDMLRDIPWSQATTFEATLERLRGLDMKTTTLDPWFDVDSPDDLLRLHRLLSNGEVRAPHSHKAITTLESQKRASKSGEPQSIHARTGASNS